MTKSLKEEDVCEASVDGNAPGFLKCLVLLNQLGCLRCKLVLEAVDFLVMTPRVSCDISHSASNCGDLLHGSFQLLLQSRCLVGSLSPFLLRLLQLQPQVCKSAPAMAARQMSERCKLSFCHAKPWEQRLGHLGSALTST